MKKIFSFSSVSKFLTYSIAALAPRLDSKLDDSKYYVTYQIFTGSKYLSVPEFTTRLLQLLVDKTFSFHISLYIISRDFGRFVSGKRRRFVIKRLSYNNYSVYEK